MKQDTLTREHIGASTKKGAKAEDMMLASIEAYMELQNPIYKIPTHLGIKAFKKGLQGHGLSKHMINKMVRIYKRRSWMEFQGISRGRGTFPVHKRYGTKIEVTDNSNNGEVNVTQSKGE